MSRWRPRSLLISVGLLLTFVAAAWWLTRRPCTAPPTPPRIVARAADRGTLRAGAASRPIELKYPVVRAGYAPPRIDATAARLTPRARAVVVQVGGVRMGWVSVELMLVSSELAQSVRTAAARLGLQIILVSATHVHSSAGEYERNWLLQAAGTGRFRAEVHDAVVSASAAALERATGQLRPARALRGEVTLPELVVSRSGGPVDPRLTRLELVAQSDQAPIAELLLFAAHPTLAPHPDTLLDTDYPGRLSAGREKSWGGVSLFLPASVGNGSAHLTEEKKLGVDSAGAYARKLEQAVSQIRMTPLSASGDGTIELKAQVVSFSAPAPELRRLLPGFIAPLGEELLCRSMSGRSELAVLSLGGLRWVAVPGEPTAEAALRLETVVGAQRTIGVTDGYLSYIEAPERVAADQGEARSQYFGGELLQRIEEAATQGLRP